MITPSFPTFLRPVATVILVTATFARAAAPAGRYTYTATSTTVLDNKTSSPGNERRADRHRLGDRQELLRRR